MDATSVEENALVLVDVTSMDGDALVLVDGTSLDGDALVLLMSVEEGATMEENALVTSVE